MTKRKTLVVLLCIFVSGFSQDNDEWSQEYDDYSSQLDEIFKVPVDEDYDNFIKKLKETREIDFEPGADDKGKVEFDDKSNELNSNENSDEPEINYEFYDNLVNDNGEVFNDGPQEFNTEEELRNIIGIENKDEAEKYYGQNINEDIVKDENINGNAPVNDYDPGEFNEDEKVAQSSSDSEEEALQRANKAGHDSEVPNEQGGHRIGILTNIIEDAKALVKQDTGRSGFRSSNAKQANTDDNMNQVPRNSSSNTCENIAVKFQEQNSEDTIRNQSKSECGNCDDNTEEAKNVKSTESKLAYANDNKETYYKIKDYFEPGEKDTVQSDYESEDEDSDNDTNEVSHIENVYDDINDDTKKLIEVMERNNYDAHNEETHGTDSDGKSPNNLNNSDINEKQDLYNNIDEHDEESEDSIANFQHGDNGIVADENSFINFKFDVQNEQIDINHVIAGKDLDYSVDKMDIDQSIPHEDDEVGVEEIYTDEKILVNVENVENSDEKQAESNGAGDHDTIGYAQDQFHSDANSADIIKENNVDDATGESKISIEDLNNEIGKFIDQHNVEILYKLKTLDISPINVKLSFDKAVTVSSPNYPEPYTGNSVIDWYFDGEGGTGIELNITNFSVDGNSGDYLLIKPGQTDTSGSNGIIFTYMLKTERRYRFMDVENMFVRFESKGSNIQNFKGFQFSVKFIELKMDRIVEPDPEPEMVAKAPEQTHTVHLAGLTLHETDKVEAFRDILLNMTAVYINAKWPQCLQPSLSEVVQLTRLTSCNVAWPHTEGCTSVTFGIPLPGDECCDGYRLTTTQMEKMWTTYSLVDPFATRMRILGISEYESPNDRAILAVWWVWTFGAVLLVCVVAFTICHLNCLHDYNGMSRLHEDTDSVKSGRKCDLSLYPTPHQTLPPMFADGKFDHYLDGDHAPDNTTRVDLCGACNNKGFVRDGELMDLDSDEEIIMSLPDEAESNTRPSYSSGIRPREVYEV